jgi:transcription termination factor NusB
MAIITWDQNTRYYSVSFIYRRLFWLDANATNDENITAVFSEEYNDHISTNKVVVLTKLLNDINIISLKEQAASKLNKNKQTGNIFMAIIICYLAEMQSSTAPNPKIITAYLKLTDELAGHDSVGLIHAVIDKFGNHDNKQD